MDRVACAWLITRFIDTAAAFSFIAPQDVAGTSFPDDVIPFVVPGAELSRRGDRITLDVMIEKYHLGNDPALSLLADIMRAADIRGHAVHPAEADGVRAIVHGFFLMALPDQEALTLQYPVLDALYRFCQEQTKRSA
jgi:hypothetical protein